MRQVFSSPRLENVEGIAQFLRDEGIEVRVTDGRSYRSAIRGNFSYRDNAEAGARPAVWIVNSDDQPRARQLLRDAGLLQSAGAPLPIDSYVPRTPHMPGSAPTPVATRRTSRFRYGLLAGIALLVALTLFATRRPALDAAPSTAPPVARTAPTPVATLPDTIAAPSVAYVIATPPALAEMLFAAELDEQDAGPACLAVDGGDPAADVLARLRGGADGRDVRAVSACPDATGARISIDVTRYRTDGSGVGTVAVVIHGAGRNDASGNRIRELEVQRTGDQWRVLRVLD